MRCWRFSENLEPPVPGTAPRVCSDWNPEPGAGNGQTPQRPLLSPAATLPPPSGWSSLCHVGKTVLCPEPQPPPHHLGTPILTTLRCIAHSLGCPSLHASEATPAGGLCLPPPTVSPVSVSWCPVMISQLCKSVESFTYTWDVLHTEVLVSLNLNRAIRLGSCGDPERHAGAGRVRAGHMLP